MPRPSTLPEPWLSLAEKLGGVQALCDALNTAPATIHHWAHGHRTPSGTAMMAIENLFWNNDLDSPWGGGQRG